MSTDLTADIDAAAMKAVVDPWPAFWLVRTFPDVMRELQAKGERLVIAGQDVEGRQFLRSAAQLRRSAAERAATLKPTPVVAEVPVGPWITAAEAAARLEVSVEQVREWARDGVIDGEGGRRGRPWRLVEKSVDILVEDRRRRLTA